MLKSERYGFVPRDYELNQMKEMLSLAYEAFLQGEVLQQKGVSFYGQAGCGKSALRREIGHQTQREGSFYVIQYDFGASNDPVVFLASLADALSSFGCNCKDFNDKFSLFCSRRPKYKIYEPQPTPIRALGEAIFKDTASYIGFSAEVPKAMKRLEDFSEDARNLIPEESTPSVYNLSESLQTDLEYWMNQSSQKPMLLLLDTYEALTRTEKDSYYDLNQDSWLEPLLNVNDICWAVFGRGPIRKEFGFRTVEVSIFHYKEAVEMLKMSGINDLKLADAVATASRGLPLYIAVFIEAYFYAVQHEATISPEELRTTNDLVSVFLKYFNVADSPSMETLCTCACLERWNMDILRGVDVHVDARLLTVQAVSDLSFVTKYDDESFSMHEVAAGAIRNHRSLQLKKDAVIKSVIDLSRQFEDEFDAEGWGEYSWWESAQWSCRLSYQCISLIREDKRASLSNIVEAQMRHTKSLDRLGLYKEAIPIEREILETLEGCGSKYQDIWRAKSNLGISLSNAGFYEDAITCHNEALKLVENHELADIKMIAKSLMDLSIAESRKAERDNDRKLHEIALEHKSEVVDLLVSVSSYKNPRQEDHRVLEAMRNLAVTLTDLNRPKEALEIEREVVKARRKKHGLHHKETLMAIDNMAGSIFSIGVAEQNAHEIERALRIHERILSLRLLCMGDKHEDIALSHYNVADSYRQLGKYDSAIEHANKAYDIYLNVHGWGHPDVDDARCLKRRIEEELQ